MGNGNGLLNMPIKVGRFTIIGLFFDMFDWIGLGLIPIIADVVDVGATLFWYAAGAGLISATSLVEIIPMADILPINVAIGLYVDGLRSRRKS